MAAVREIKKEVNSNLEATKQISKVATQKMFAELTKGQNIRHPFITTEQIAQAVTKSMSGMNGEDQETLNQFGQAFQALLESTLTPPQRRKKMKRRTSEQRCTFISPRSRAKRTEEQAFFVRERTKSARPTATEKGLPATHMPRLQIAPPTPSRRQPETKV